MHPSVQRPAQTRGSRNTRRTFPQCGRGSSNSPKPADGSSQPMATDQQPAGLDDTLSTAPAKSGLETEVLNFLGNTRRQRSLMEEFAAGFICVLGESCDKKRRGHLRRLLEDMKRLPAYADFVPDVAIEKCESEADEKRQHHLIQAAIDFCSRQGSEEPRKIWLNYFRGKVLSDPTIALPTLLPEMKRVSDLLRDC